MHINAQSLLPKIPELCLLVEESKYDCISVSETWLNSSFIVSELNIPGFNLFRNDRKDKPHAGVAIYASPSLSPILISASFKTEIISVKVKLKSKSILIVSLYRPPRACAAYFDDTLQDLEIAHSLNPNMIIMGDMNFDALTDNGHSKVTEIETSFLLKQIISSPTWVTAVSQTLTDHIYVSSHLSPTECGVLPIPFSGHCPVFAVFPLCKSTHHTHQTIRKRTYKHFNYDAFIHELINSELFSTFYDQTDVSIASSSFRTEFLRICNKYAPIQHIPVKYTSKNWITELIHIRNHAHQKALRTLSVSDWKHYKSLRNTITCKIRKFKKQFYQ